jgi:putative ABC transport system ATP-binding protein
MAGTHGYGNTNTNTSTNAGGPGSGPGSAILEVEGLAKSYRSGERTLEVLREVSFRLPAGETLAIVGPSGSGKTTLLGLCAGLDAPTAGTVRLAGEDLGRLDEDGRARVRNRHTGFVFQSFQLIPTLTALENVMVPLELRGERGLERQAGALLEQVGLAERLDHYPAQLSGGEQQRVAIARAFINRPKILFADEPTGNLDAETGGRVVEALFRLNAAAGTALVLVTHDLDLAGRTRRRIRLRGGAVIEDSGT